MALNNFKCKHLMPVVHFKELYWRKVGRVLVDGIIMIILLCFYHYILRIDALIYSAAQLQDCLINLLTYLLCMSVLGA